MRLFKLLRRCEFWPSVPWRRGRRKQRQWLPQGTTVIEILLADAPLAGPGQTTVEVWEGEFKGYQRYANKSELVERSPLELLAEASDDV